MNRFYGGRLLKRALNKGAGRKTRVNVPLENGKTPENSGFWGFSGFF
jgi:hypothetical protein